MTKSNGNISNIPLVNTIAFRSLIAFTLVFFVTLAGGAIILTSNRLQEEREGAKVKTSFPCIRS